MVRKTVAFMLILGGCHVTLLALQGIGVVPPGSGARAEDGAGTQDSAVSEGQFIVRDAFDDNAKGTPWRVLADDPNNCMMTEVNQRLELQATSQASMASTGYISGGWRLDPRCDFALKVDFHYDLMSYPRGWVGMGVTPDVVDPWERNAAVGVGCNDAYAHYWHRKQTGLSVNSSSSQRTRTDGTLYIAYNATADELYLGLASYNSDDAWSILPGLVKGEWGSRPIFIWLAGGSDGLAVPSGRVYLDNLVVETGVIMEASLRDVHRFWSPVLERHFYTINESEKETLTTQYKDMWTYEGVVYHAFATNADPDTRPVYRFWSDKLGSHFYTVNESEKDWLVAEYAHVWTLEGVAFYAYPPGLQPVGTLPVYRFWSPTTNDHLYTISESERKSLLANFSGLWTDEGIAWYAIE
jgi:hypothetical protein